MLEPECEYNLNIKMEELYDEALKKIPAELLDLMQDKKFIKIFADFLAWGCRDENIEAEDIKEYLGLSDEEIAAIAGDADWLYSIIKENQALAKADDLE